MKNAFSRAWALFGEVFQCPAGSAWQARPLRRMRRGGLPHAPRKASGCNANQQSSLTELFKKKETMYMQAAQIFQRSCINFRRNRFHLSTGVIIKNPRLHSTRTKRSFYPNAPPSVHAGAQKQQLVKDNVNRAVENSRQPVSSSFNLFLQ